MTGRATRRRFLQTTAVATAGYWVAAGVQAKESKSPNEKIQFACIGIGGKGGSDSADAKRNGTVVAVCDIDDGQLASATKRFPGAKKFFDYRTLFSEMGDKIDAVTVSTPDHHHGPAAATAMRLGKHCFCQKPLARTIFEARTLAEIAKEKKVATQMGNQGTAEPGLRRAAALIQSGVLGTVKEVHVWTNRPVWPQGGSRPKPSPQPKNIHWQEFIGPAPERPYAGGYQPFVWRGWWDFGCGALGDMACHTVNMPYMALRLRDPISAEATTSGHNKDSYPKWSKIHYVFPATDKRPEVSLFWYDGGQRPDPKTVSDPTIFKPGSGCVVIGEKGWLFSPDDYGAKYHLGGGAVEPKDAKLEIVRSPGHFDEWVAAIKGGKPAMSNFAEYAGPLTESLLVGNLAVWQNGKKVEWDAKNMKATNAPELDFLIKPVLQHGYTI
ncbi:MAG: Gfo/Idh/MocA family oxidoreductase [Planctomycetia bacterium]|nr:Gfo/Idh/MocA family oxidoreductase [Planctomycetia bacterium]